MPGTSFQLDPVQAAFNIGAMIRWLDFNDTWLAAEWGHPSDNLGGILAIADWLSRNAVAAGKPPLTMRDVLTAMIKAHEIQGVIALENSFNRVGLDHVVLVKVASTAVVAQHARAHARRDRSTRCRSPGSTASRCAPTATRRTPARARAGRRATRPSRAVRLALIAKTGEMGYPSVLTAKTWGFYDVLFKGKPFKFQRPYGSYVMENVLFKISFPAEFHAQTAVECAMQLHPRVKDRLDDIEKITIRTHESAIRIIDKKGPLDNPADRDHCIQYMVAVPLIYGRLTAADYEDDVAADPRIDALRDKMDVRRGQARSRSDYHDPGQALDRQRASRSSSTTAARRKEVVVEYPIGHRRRRKEGIPVLVEKFRTNLARRFPAKQQQAILDVALDAKTLDGDAGARVRRPDGDLTARPSLATHRTIHAHASPSSLLAVAAAPRRAAAAGLPEAQVRACGKYDHVDAEDAQAAAAARSTMCTRRRGAEGDDDRMATGMMPEMCTQARHPVATAARCIGDAECKIGDVDDAVEVGDDAHRRHRVPHRASTRPTTRR